MRAALIVMSMVLMTNQVSATDKMLLGPGAASCGRWLEAPQHSRIIMQAWVQGYVSGINLTESGNDFLVGTDARAIVAWLDSYCRQHPLENLATASQSLTYELKMRKTK